MRQIFLSRTLCVLAALCLPVAASHAQEFLQDTDEVFETDRDSFTPATSLVPESRVMVETAWGFTDNRDVSDTNSFPELLIRYGANDWIELRFGTNYEIGGESSQVSSSGGTDVQTGDNESNDTIEEAEISYGLKIAVTDQDQWIPESALILRGSTPTSGHETVTTFTGSYVFGWEFDNDWVWDTSIRYSSSGTGEERETQWTPSTILKIPVGEAWNVHAEYFGGFSTSEEGKGEKHYFSPGIHYEICKDVELGVRIGWGLNEQSANFFSNAGIGWLF